jgi:hypothetical protein
LCCYTKDEYGFDAARAGLTAEEAADLASTFARFDVNGNGKLNSGRRCASCVCTAVAFSQILTQA